MTPSSYSNRSSTSGGGDCPYRSFAPVEGELAQVGPLGVTLGHREARQHRLAELELDVRPLGDPQRAVARLGHLGEHRPHLGRGLQVVLVAFEAEAILLVDLRVGLDAQQRVVGHRVALMGVVAVVRREQRRIDCPRDLHQLRVGAVLVRDPVVLQLDEQVLVPEDVLQPSRDRERARPRRP